MANYLRLGMRTLEAQQSVVHRFIDTHKDQALRTALREGWSQLLAWAFPDAAQLNVQDQISAQAMIMLHSMWRRTYREIKTEHEARMGQEPGASADG